MKMRTLTKKPFTLFEIMVVMAIIASALGVLSFQISKALRGEKFERTIDQIIAKLALAQELMLDFHTDVKVALNLGQKELTCVLSVDKKLPLHLENSFNRHNAFDGIEQILCDGNLKNSIELLYDGSLGETPKAELTFISRDKSAVIFLNGYPSQIKRGACEQKKEYQVPYPEEIFSSD